MTELASSQLTVFRESEIRLLTDIATAISELGNESQEDRERLLDVAQDLREMFFLIAVIGEFNAGKSTFVNALLGENVLPTGITPTTEVIELIRYAESPNLKPEIKNNTIREWKHPNTGGIGVALVDTPGTGSVFQKHETTAKAFLHRSDLVIFLVSAKRAFAETERLYLELAKNYGKKIILVVNQIDLISPSERVEVRRFVERQVQEFLNFKPLIFLVSARDALQNPTDGDAEGIEGMKALRAHLRGVLNEMPPAKQKLLAQLDTAERTIQKYLSQIKGNVSAVNADVVKVRDVQNEMNQQALGLTTQLKAARADIDSVFAGLRQRGKTFIDEYMSIRKWGRLRSKEVIQAEFESVVVGRAMRDIAESSNEYVNALVDNSRQYWRGVIERLNQLRDVLDQELSGLDSNIYTEQRQALEDAIRIAETELRSYSDGRLISELDTIFRQDLSTFTWSTLAFVSGAILTVLAVGAPGPIIGAGAAVLALPALLVGAPALVAGGYATVRYLRRLNRKTKEEFDARVDKLESSYHEALDQLTQKERTRLQQYGSQVLTPIFSRLEVLTQKYATQERQLTEQEKQLGILRKGIEDL